jgi:hypothetical protein
MSAEDETTLPEPVRELYERFVEALRAGDVETAHALAPDVAIETEGWPYEDETGPINVDAFAGDPRLHRVMGWEETGPERYELGSGAGWYTIERVGDDLRIVEAGLKPVE